MTVYALHVAGECNPYACPVCAAFERDFEARTGKPERPILCDYHARIVEAAHATTRPEKEALAAMADDFAHDCNHCEAP